MTAIYKKYQYTLESILQDFKITLEQVPGEILFAAWRVDMNEPSVFVIGRHQNRLWHVSASIYDSREDPNWELDDDHIYAGLWDPKPVSKEQVEKWVIQSIEYLAYYTARYTLPGHWFANIESDAVGPASESSLAGEAAAKDRA